MAPLSTSTDGLSVTLHVGRFGYENSILFENLDLTIEAGKVTCLLGQSGVGKSSILKMLAGLMRLSDEDQVTCGDGRPLRGRVAYMDQRDLLYPWLKVLGNATLGARLRGEAPDNRRARGILAEVGLEDEVDAYPATLSGGMRQRVALARTLLEDCPVVLMDEPFSALDAMTRHHLQDLAARQLAGRTVLLVTHDPMEALRLGHNVMVLGGRPAQLTETIIPPGLPPRFPADPALARLHQQLLTALGIQASGIDK